MRQVQAGRIDAFEVLYDRYCDRAFRAAWMVCQDRGRAEDAVQDAFTAIWRTSSSYSPERGTVATWLMTVVRYRAIDVTRRQEKHTVHRASEEFIDSRAAPGDVGEEAIARAEADRLHALLDRLPEAQREVIALAFFGGLTHTEISTVLGLPAGTVKGRIRLGLEKLRVATS